MTTSRSRLAPSEIAPTHHRVAQPWSVKMATGEVPLPTNDAQDQRSGIVRGDHVCQAARMGVLGENAWSYAEYERECRCTVKTVGLPVAADKCDAVTLADGVRKFMTNTLELSEGQVDGLGGFTASRPTNLDKLKPVEVMFERKKSRDFLMSQMGVLTRAKKKLATTKAALWLNTWSIGTTL